MDLGLEYLNLLPFFFNNVGEDFTFKYSRHKAI